MEAHEVASSGDYQFPLPEDKSEWQGLVQGAIAAQTLMWRQVEGHKWVISGTCPKCSHATNQFVDLEVLVANALSGTAFDASEEREISIELVCACDETPPHREKTRGCGFGKGLVIVVANPEVTHASN
jgi:hypothetical protein